MKAKKKSVRKNSKSVDLAKWRGVIIESAINIERMLNVILMCHFSKRLERKSFLQNFIEHRDITSRTKIDILDKSDVLKDNNILGKKLRRLLEIRNLFAHAKHDFNDSDYSMFLQIRSKKPEDASALVIEFHELYNETVPHLSNLMEKYEN